MIMELFFRAIIVQVIGVYSRYIFYKIIGRKKSIEHLSGADENDGISGTSQAFFNALVGLIVFCSLAVGIAYLVFS